MDNKRWKEETRGSDKGNVFWVITANDLEARLERKATYQWVSRIPGMHQLCYKSPFARLMNHMQDERPEAYEFWPKTYIVPLSPKTDTTAIFSKGPMIFKPDEGSQGDGIYLIMSKADWQRQMEVKPQDGVLQRYLGKPLLLDGQFKFDFRVYVLLLSLDPVRIFLCREGLVRACVEPYEPLSSRNKHKVSSHLTNYSLSKRERNYQHVDNPDCGKAGTKRTMSAVLANLHNEGVIDGPQCWSALREVVLNTTLAMADCLRGKLTTSSGADVPTASSMWPVGPITPNQERTSFNILGLDVILDVEQRWHLLEMNSNPSMEIDSVFPMEGPDKEDPPPLPEPGMPYHEVAGASYAMMQRGRGGKHCKCMGHHRPHVHRPCLCDIVAKTAAVKGALKIAQRDMKAHKAGKSSRGAAHLAAGTEYEVVYSALWGEHMLGNLCYPSVRHWGLVMKGGSLA
ncbi:hypothetical protein CYMTET_51091 [Cymbomonas tetramitiformis]|uniref:Uncharacterized protein n=1 Tax=Cymbomonas tetramitiformis TaxID=36881 RepID=A0AAE0BLU0_9CHLO|nr:hypothetical protein CYMTET_51091 [Cymbomonas tetramitiformis]